MSDAIGCGDNSCVFRVLRKSGGMGTNGGCRCFKDLVMTAKGVCGDPYSNRDEVRRVAQDTQRLAGELRRAKEQRDELLAALKGLLDGMIRTHGDEHDGESLYSVRVANVATAHEAIAKAKGGTP